MLTFDKLKGLNMLSGILNGRLQTYTRTQGTIYIIFSKKIHISTLEDVVYKNSTYDGYRALEVFLRFCPRWARPLRGQRMIFVHLRNSLLLLVSFWCTHKVLAYRRLGNIFRNILFCRFSTYWYTSGTRELFPYFLTSFSHIHF